MTRFRDITAWKKELGLLPVPLLQGDDSSFVLFNGTRGNFCLYLGKDRLDDQTRSDSWSANVGHAVALKDGEAFIQRWDRPDRIQRIGIGAIEAYPDQFHEQLETDAPASEASVVAHAVRVFRVLRSYLGPDSEGEEALNAFLYLLAVAVDTEAGNEIDLRRWHLDPGCQLAASKIRQLDWETLVSELHSAPGAPAPNLDLTLSHASGALFQAAHYEAVFSGFQPTLPGIPPQPVKLDATTAAVGVHFTPVAIVRNMVEEALSLRSCDSRSIVKILDPACGSGEFLREALRLLMLDAGFDGEVHLYGFDISPAACAMARFVLGWEARGQEDRVFVRIENRDALEPSTEWPTEMDFVLMNPPFLSWRDQPTKLRARVLDVLGSFGRLRPDLSTAFLWKAVSSLAEGAVLGAVVPSSLLDGRSFVELREKLARVAGPRVLARLGSHDLFPGARVDASIYIGQREETTAAVTVVWADHRPSSTSACLRALRRLRSRRSLVPKFLEGEGYSIYDASIDPKRWAPRPYRQWKFAESIRSLPSVGSLFEVRQGVLTGLNKAFILRSADLGTLPEPERRYFRPCVVNRSIHGGAIVKEWFVFYPHGDMTVDSENELRAQLPEYYKGWLSRFAEDLKERRLGAGQQWWELTRPRGWQDEAIPKLISTYFGAEGSFAWDPESEYVVVQGYAWMPKRSLVRDLSRSLWLAYLALLNSTRFREVLAAYTNSVGGGQLNLSKRYVGGVPLPNLFKVRNVFESEINLLAEVGAQIHERSLMSLSSSDIVQLEELAETVFVGAAESDLNG